MRDLIRRGAVALTLLLVVTSIGGTATLALDAGASPSVAVQEAFSAEVETYNGQVAVEDGVVTVSGTAATSEDVVVVFVGDRGSVIASALPVTGERFSQTIELDTAEGPMEEGFVDGIVLSVGSDGVFGQPGDGPDSADELVAFASDLSDRDLTQDQTREVLLEATANGDGSDDLFVETPFVLTQGDIRISDVVPASDRQASGIQAVPAGETMVVRGVTNRRPSRVLIEISAEGPNGTSLDVATVDEWGTDGAWEVEIPVPSDASPGTYTVLADDGERSARADVEVVEASASTPTATSEPTTDSTPTPTATQTQTTTAGAEPTPEPTPEPTTTETESSGFGVLVALAAVAVVLVALAGLVGSRSERP